MLSARPFLTSSCISVILELKRSFISVEKFLQLDHVRRLEAKNQELNEISLSVFDFYSVTL
jgi:hypothetical protein